jgi:hypothetical protein
VPSTEEEKENKEGEKEEGEEEKKKEEKKKIPFLKPFCFLISVLLECR